ncbi:shikimate dehydrogenase [Roseibium sp. Sym1]|uniref:shikimate dehydrogenase n=1 Tax=Roseibium sp. Sym1 TaxID=3016006 RepID=UPI0022B4B1FB|nr:shikimate dehydrogenase [Roseibium sp. Sym1]
MIAGQQPLGTPRTILAGLVGSGIQRSRTPAMHEAEGAANGIRLVYRLFDTGEMGARPPPLAEILRSAEVCGFSGLNVTYPFKLEVMEHLDELSENARAIGAVNTVVFAEGKRVGHNTDLWGFAESFRRALPGVPRRRVLLVGAGGAGVAAAFAMMENGAEHLRIHDKDPAKAAAVADAVCRQKGPGAASLANDLAEASRDIDGLINATPVGMDKLPGTPFPLDLLCPSMWVADVIYFPLETELLKAAQDRGCLVMGGAGMAVFQAVRAFELFTGITPDPDRFSECFASLG